MTSHPIVRVALLAALLGTLGAGVAEARNPNCAGGIQYVTQALRDKEKGNTEDYVREINKAVSVLSKCLSEDPADFEAIGYLGWAYAEIESVGPAGKAFDHAIKGAEGKGNVKLVDQVKGWRQNFYVQFFNQGIGKIKDAQNAYANFCDKPKNESETTLRGQAEKSYGEATSALNKALLLKPGDLETIRNLATVYALQCNYPMAQTMVQKGLEAAPGDSTLLTMNRRLQGTMVGTMAEQNKFDEAITSLNELIKTEPTNADHYVSLAEILYRKAEAEKGDAMKADFRAAGDAYAKASSMKPTQFDFAFNGGVAYQNAQAWDKAEPLWALAVKLDPNNTDARSAWAATLSELKRCPEAVQALHPALLTKPQEKTLHRQMGAIYTKCGNNQRATDELMLFLALDKGKPVADAAADAKAAKQGSDAAKTLASDGAPDQVYEWEAEGQKYKTWVYWSKKRAFAFQDGALRHKSDWSTADTKTAGAGKP